MILNSIAFIKQFWIARKQNRLTMRDVIIIKKYFYLLQSSYSIVCLCDEHKQVPYDVYFILYILYLCDEYKQVLYGVFFILYILYLFDECTQVLYDVFFILYIL